MDGMPAAETMRRLVFHSILLLGAVVFTAALAMLVDSSTNHDTVTLALVLIPLGLVFVVLKFPEEVGSLGSGPKSRDTPFSIFSVSYPLT